MVFSVCTQAVVLTTRRNRDMLSAVEQNNMAKTKAHKQIAAIAAAYGFKLHRHTRHMIFRDAKGHQVVTASTTSDNKRCLKNFEAQLRRSVAMA